MSDKAGSNRMTDAERRITREAVLDVYKDQRTSGEHFARTLERVGMEPFKTAANAARQATARAATV